MKSAMTRSRKRRAVALTLAALAAFYMLMSFFLGEMGVVKDVRLRQERSSLKREVEQLRESNAKLAREVEMLKDDPEQIERLAREQGLVKEGELIYQYEKE